MTTNYRLDNGKVDWQKAEPVIIAMSNDGARPIDVEEVLRLPSSTVSARISLLRASGLITAQPAAGGRRPLRKGDSRALPRGTKIDMDKEYGPIDRIVSTGCVRVKDHVTTHLAAD